MFALGDVNSSTYISGTNLYINDMNPDLVATYEVISEDVESLIVELERLRLKVTAEDFYQMRASKPEEKLQRASRFIYLNKTCFNGLWRVNSKGDFNVPFGHNKNPTLFDINNLRACSERLQGATVTNLSFEQAVESASPGDLVYFDPPYIPLSPSSSFAAYSKEGFGLEAHKLLSETISSLTKKGVYVILSNSDTGLTREIFGDSVDLRQKSMARSIAASGSKRGSVNEVIGVNYQHLNESSIKSLSLISESNSYVELKPKKTIR